MDQKWVENGSRVVRIGWAGSCWIAVAYVNRGETVCTSKSFKTIKGAEKWANQWVTR